MLTLGQFYILQHDSTTNSSATAPASSATTFSRAAYIKVLNQKFMPNLIRKEVFGILKTCGPGHKPGGRLLGCSLPIGVLAEQGVRDASDSKVKNLLATAPGK